MASEETVTPTPQKNGALGLSPIEIGILISVGIFATTMAQTQTVGRIPLTNLLKNTVHASREQTSVFFFWMGLAWYLKPFAGILTDAFPLLGTRRTSYIVIGSIGACASWIGLAFVKQEYQSLLIACMILNLFMVIVSTVTGAILVQAGQALGATGRFTSLRNIVSSVCGLAYGPLGGFFATLPLMYLCGANAIVVVTMIPATIILWREKPVKVDTSQALSDSRKQLASVFASPVFLLSIVFIGLFYFSPGFSTVLFYRQQNEFHLSTPQIGGFTTASALGALLSSSAYAIFCRKITLRWIILAGIVTAAGGTLFYFLYSANYAADLLIEFQNGVFFGWCEVALLHLAARSTPKGAEGLGYSLMLSMRNVALFGADVVGSKLADDYKWPFAWLVCLNAGTTAFVLVLLPLLPKAAVDHRDGEGQAEAA